MGTNRFFKYILFFVISTIALVSFARAKVERFEHLIVRQTEQVMLQSARYAADYFADRVNFLIASIGLLKNNTDFIKMVKEGRSPEDMAQVYGKDPESLPLPFLIENVLALERLDSRGRRQRAFPSNQRFIKQDLSDQKDVQAVMANGGWVLDTAIAGPEGEHLAAYSEAIMEGDQLVGIYRIVAFLDNLDEFFSGLTSQIQHDLAVLQLDGTVVYHSQHALIGENITAAIKEQSPSFDWSSFDQAFSVLSEGEEGSRVYDEQYQEGYRLIRKRNLMVFVPVRIKNNLFMLAIIVDFEKIAGPIRKYAWHIFLAVLFILLCSTIGSVYFYFSRKKHYELQFAQKSANLHEETNIKLKHEVADRLKAEQELKVANQDLKKNQAALTNMLYDMRQTQEELTKVNKSLREAQGRLLQSEKMAAIGQLSAGVAHEIKNPLAIILLSVENFETRLETLDERNKRNLHMVKQAAERANKVVVELLNFSRSSEINLQPISLAETIRSSVSLVENIAKTKDIEIEMVTREDEDNLVVSGDKILLQQVFFNLFSNALDTMETGKISIKTEVSPEKKFVMIEVSDTGEGIPQDLVSHVFEPFFTTKEQGKGTGLGLSTVYMIIERHKGLIEVESAVGEGTTFKITLPLVDAPNKTGA